MLLNLGEITPLRKTANKSRFIASEKWGEKTMWLENKNIAQAEKANNSETRICCCKWDWFMEIFLIPARQIVNKNSKTKKGNVIEFTSLQDKKRQILQF